MVDRTAELSTRHSSMEEERSHLQREIESVGGGGDAGAAPANLEGYLLKRGHNKFRTWNWRFFSLDLDKGCMIYYVDKVHPPSDSQLTAPPRFMRYYFLHILLCTHAPLPHVLVRNNVLC